MNIKPPPFLDIHHHEDSVEAFTVSSLLCPPSAQQIAVTLFQMETSRSNLDLQSYQHASLSLRDSLVHPQESESPDCDDDDDGDGSSTWEAVVHGAQKRLLDKAQDFSLDYDSNRGYRSTALQFTSFARPHMRAFHASWICYFTTFFVQFSQASLFPEIQRSLHLTKAQIWRTNVWMMVGGIPMRFLLGALCDQYGARTVMTATVAAVALPAVATGLWATSATSLTWCRFLLGGMDSFVPGQYWITCHFVREVAGTAMAMAGGLGAAGSGVAQLVTGSVLFPLLRSYVTAGDDDSEQAWRLALILPAMAAFGVAYFFFWYADDCPLGNLSEVKKAGLLMERSAVDSFRSGTMNVNSWILFVQFAGSCGVDFTMCNGTAAYFHAVFGQSTAASAALGFCYGVSAIYARGLGGWWSDALSDRFSLRGRLWAHLVALVAQGCLNIWLARTTAVLSHAVIILFEFSIAVQVSMGACYSIVPYVDGPNTGSVAGIVGAGGNAGAVLLAQVFIKSDYRSAMAYMGWWTILTALLTPLIIIKGYRGLLWGREVDSASDPEGALHRQQHSPLLVPGKLQQSPHLVSMHAKQQKTPRLPPHLVRASPALR